MIYHVLLVAHIAVLGYWLGSELCINSEYRFICMRNDIGFAARDAMTDHLMDIDQHVRYALILQLTLGGMLAALAGIFAEYLVWVLPILGLCWLALVESAHRLRKRAVGETLAQADRIVRYAVMALLVLGAIGMAAEVPYWLRMKLGLFAALIGCGIWIRFLLMRHFSSWAEMRERGPTESAEAIIRNTYWKATSVLVLLWLCIGSIAALAIWKPT